jgi:acyl-coenzyme A synthetase/AMP-(fatty) acid ligase
VLAYRAGRPIYAAQFLAAAATLAAELPAGRHVINVCADRYGFAVGLAAAVLAGKVSLLPPSHTPQVVRHLREFAPDVFCLTDRADCAIDLPQVHYREAPSPAPSAPQAWHVPHVPPETLIAYVFTSGSTGVPVPHPKTWGRLVGSVREGIGRLGLAPGTALLATVPAQHMYGFESSVLLPLVIGAALVAERPFYPADIAQALAALPRPRALISTPIHLRAILAAGLTLPPADLIVSATAPLDAALAREAEARFDAPLIEIYGSTETGQLATRRTACEPVWHLWPGVRLRRQAERFFAGDGHLEAPTPLADAIELLEDGTFVLQGRLTDLVNVAGKRSSLGYLTHQLLAIEGVLDGTFFLPERPGASGISRLAAVVVAPGLSEAQLLAGLRERLDPVFLPRPLLRVERLPRNSTGKLPQEALAALLDAAGRP